MAVINASSVNPPDEAFLLSEKRPLFTLEESMLSGGFGQQVSAFRAAHALPLPLHLFALPDAFIPHGKRKELLAQYGLDAETIAKTIEDRLHETKN